MNGLAKLLLLGAVAYALYANWDLLNSSLNIIRRVESDVTAQIEMQSIARAIVMHYVNEETLPVRDFSGFMRENMRTAAKNVARDPACDMWGTAYVFRLRDTDIELYSAGPDRKWRTPDDIRHVQFLTVVETPERIRAKVAELTGRPSAGDRESTGSQARPPAPERGRRPAGTPKGWQF